MSAGVEVFFQSTLRWFFLIVTTLDIISIHLYDKWVKTFIQNIKLPFCMIHTQPLDKIIKPIGELDGLHLTVKM